MDPTAPTPSGGALSEAVAAAMAKLADPGFKPPIFPDTALQLLQIARQPSSVANFAHVERIMERDPLLVARVLRVAQSPAYAGGARVRTLRDAGIRLGLRALADLFLEAALHARVFRVPGLDGPMKQMREHALATAHAARILALRVGHLEDAFLCGLLLDVGKAVLLSIIAEQHKGVPYDRIEPLLQDCHEQAGASLVRLWGLPDEVARVIGRHHAPSPREPLDAVLLLADTLARAKVDAEIEVTDAVRAALDVLELTDADLQRTRDLLSEALCAA
jgi:HD-like signal output (HDOD) protein